MRSFLAGLLAHEWIFGAYLATTWVRLVLAAGFLHRQALLFLAVLAAGVALTAWASRRDTGLRWRLRLAFHPVAMNLCFMAMAAAVPIIQPHAADALLADIDATIFGRTPSLALEPLVNRPLTEAMSLCYLLFFPGLAFAILYYLAGDLRTAKRFFAGLFSLYGIGFLGYTILPAKGPYVAMASQFSVPLEGWWLTTWNAELVRAGSNGADVFPSLHCAVSAFILFFDRRNRPWRYRLQLVPFVGLWISTVYLRYHYLVDVVAGFALAGCCLWIARARERSAEEAVT